MNKKLSESYLIGVLVLPLASSADFLDGRRGLDLWRQEVLHVVQRQRIAVVADSVVFVYSCLTRQVSLVALNTETPIKTRNPCYTRRELTSSHF